MVSSCRGVVSSSKGKLPIISIPFHLSYALKILVAQPASAIFMRQSLRSPQRAAQLCRPAHSRIPCTVSVKRTAPSHRPIVPMHTSYAIQPMRCHPTRNHFPHLSHVNAVSIFRTNRLLTHPLLASAIIIWRALVLAYPLTLGITPFDKAAYQVTTARPNVEIDSRNV